MNPMKNSNAQKNNKDNKSPNKDNQPPTPPKVGRGVLSWFLIIGGLAILFTILNNANQGIKIDTYNEFIERAKAGEFERNRVVINDTSLTAKIKNRSTASTNLPQDDETIGSIAPGTPIWTSIDASNRDSIKKDLDSAGVSYAFDTGTDFWKTVLIGYGPIILLVGLIWFFLYRSMKGAAGGPGGILGNFGKSKHRVSNKDSMTLNFGDVAGIDEAKEEVSELVEFLKDPKKFQRLGGRIPRGVLMVGPPGCGKTLLAKAIAGEAEVPFFSISGSDFVEMFVGVGASRVRDLFKQAKENAPCIIFLDEIDAVGRRRGGGFSSGGNDEREQTLNAILVEMDGFEATDQVIVIAATNRVDVLDPALTRPGRFDREVHVSYPDVEGRLEILKVHAKKITLAQDVDLERLARGTPMFSGADLAALINEAAILATMSDKDAVDIEDLEEARDKVRYGRAKKSKKFEEKELKATAYHEAGHACVQMLLEHADPVHKVTIIPRGQALGATFSLPEKDRYGYDKRFLLDTLKVLCAGRIAEEKYTGDISSGAAMDIKMATNYAKSMILEWGMSEKIGFVHYGDDHDPNSLVTEKSYSQNTAQLIDQEIHDLIEHAYNDAKKIINDHWDEINAITENLLKYETLQREDLEKIMRGERLDKQSIADLLESEKNKSTNNIEEVISEKSNKLNKEDETK